MVYRGKPSQACEPCRNRKIKCDFKSPACTQCIRAKEKCTGYRNCLDLMFLDQSKVVIRKQKARAQGKLKTNGSNRQGGAGSNGGSPDVGKPDHRNLAQDVYILQRPVTPDVDDLATSFFFKNYVLAGNGNPGFLSYISELLTRTNDKTLTAALTSVGRAGLAYIHSSQELRVSAVKRYNTTLSEIRTALKDPTKVVMDETLAVIILLSLYEEITCDSQQSMRAWYDHICGASALVKLRGRRQLQSELGVQLFLHLRSQIIIGCLQTSEALPEFIQQCAQFTVKLQTNDQIQAVQLGNIISRLCEIRAFIQTSTQLDSLGLIAACLDIDKDLTTWSTHLLSMNDYATIILEGRSEEVYEMHYHVYRDLWSARLWNCYRVAKLMTHEIVLVLVKQYASSSSTPFTMFPSQYYQSLMEMHQNSLDIVASIPFHLGFHNSNISPPLAVGGMFAMWPLYAAARIEMSAGSMREWSIKRLEFIGNTTGIKQAIALSRVLRKRAVWEDSAVTRDISLDQRTNDPDTGIPIPDHVLWTTSWITKRRYFTDMPSKPLEIA
ncbi:hypothetical protein F5884DRAFT_899823 [Xylogone sp. PMI_703]|nr:hypothetical protein F5884DRAFT_899823 [Xylogone sp. PMI_703]